MWACGSSQAEMSLCQRAWTTNLLCHSLFKTDILLPSFSFLCPSTETLAVCVNEKTANPQLHTAALQFLCAVFTEETKARSIGDMASNRKPAAALCDVVRSPSAGQLCDLLLQVCRTYLNCFHLFFIWNHFERNSCFTPTSEFWEDALSGPFKKVDSQSSDDVAGLQPHGSSPCS